MIKENKTWKYNKGMLVQTYLETRDQSSLVSMSNPAEIILDYTDHMAGSLSKKSVFLPFS